MAEAPAAEEAFQFILRQCALHERLFKLQSPNAPAFSYDHTSNIAELKELLHEAEECHAIYEQYGTAVDMVVPPDHHFIQAMGEDRLHAGLSVDHPPSKSKVFAWGGLKVARLFLAEAYEYLYAYDQAIPLYHLLVNQALRMREEMWEKQYVFHEMIQRLANCYSLSGQFDEAKKWYERGLVFCEREDPGSDNHQQIKDLLTKLTADKAGPQPSNLDGGDGGSKKAWKKCWDCGAEESPDKKLLRCNKCYTLNLATPAYYCDSDCQRKDWSRHKLYHKALDKNQSWGGAELTAEEVLFHQEHQDEYSQLIQQAFVAQEQERNLKNARRILEKAVKLEPDFHLAHLNLAIVFDICRNSEDMIREYQVTMRLTENDASLQDIWTRSVVSIYWACRGYGACPHFENKPNWCSDPPKLFSLAQRACRGDPGSDQAWFMLGAACEALGEMKDAQKYYRKAEDLAESQELKDLFRRHIERARQLQQVQQQRS